MWVRIGTTAAIFVIVVLSVISCTPTMNRKRDVRKCAPNFCQVALFKCISEDSCNGTLVPPTEPCQCCPSCVVLKDEGDICGNEGENIRKLSTTIQPSSLSSKTIEIQTETINQAKDHKHVVVAEKKCKPGLTCLQGKCVTIY